MASYFLRRLKNLVTGEYTEETFNDEQSSGYGRSGDSRMRLGKRQIIFFGALVCVIVIIVICTTSRGSGASYHTPEARRKSSEHHARRDGYSIEDVYSGRFRPWLYNATWVSDSEIAFVDSTNALVLLDVEEDEDRVLVPSAVMNRFRGCRWKISADRQFVMLILQHKKLFRHSAMNVYFLHYVGDDPHPRQGPTMLKPNRATNSPGDVLLRHADWSPEGNSLVYVFENNLYFRRRPLDRSTETQLTFDSSILNGVPDWVYEEEIIEADCAIWWSPNGSKVAYATFDDRDVGEVEVLNYGFYADDNYNYSRSSGKPLVINYPRVGTRNPIVQLYVTNLQTIQAHVHSNAVHYSINPSRKLLEQDHLLMSVSWANESAVSAVWSNRFQNYSEVNMCFQDTHYDCETAFVTEEDHGWVDYKLKAHFQEGNPTGRFLLVNSDKNTTKRYRQLVRVDWRRSSVTFVTDDRFEVTKILKWARDGSIYFEGTGIGDPGERQLYRLGGNVLTCLSCNATMNGTREACKYSKSELNPGATKFILSCLGPDVPWTCIHEIGTGIMSKSLEENRLLREHLKSLPKSETVFKEFELSSTAPAKARVRLLIPPNAEKSGRKYPLFVRTYAGPGFQSVDHRWKMMTWSYGEYLAANDHAVFAVIDGSGSGYQGDKLRHAVYRQFGGPEVQDQLEVTRRLQNSLDYVDSEKTVLFGWSYGGFVTLSALAKDPNPEQPVFKCGIAVAPVVDWTLYDSIYTERYMGSWEDNAVGYKSSHAMSWADNIKDHTLLLMQGTGDDNVHLRNSMLLSKILEERGILFHQQFYPDQNHQIGGYLTHLYKTTNDFFMHEC